MRANNLSEIRNAISEDISNSKSKHRQDVRDLRYTKNRSLLIFAFRATNAVLGPDRAQPSRRP